MFGFFPSHSENFIPALWRSIAVCQANHVERNFIFSFQSFYLFLFCVCGCLTLPFISTISYTHLRIPMRVDLTTLPIDRFRACDIWLWCSHAHHRCERLALKIQTPPFFIYLFSFWWVWTTNFCVTIKNKTDSFIYGLHFGTCADHFQLWINDRSYLQANINNPIRMDFLRIVKSWQRRRLVSL